MYLLEAEVILKCRLGCISLSKNSNCTDPVINLKVINSPLFYINLISPGGVGST